MSILQYLKKIITHTCFIIFITTLVSFSSSCYNSDDAHDTTGVNQNTKSRTTDTIPPTPGTLQVLPSLTTTNSVSIMYSDAYDNETPANQMQYALYKSSQLNIATIADIEANGTLLIDWTTGKANTAIPLEPLAPGTKFHINVIAMDAAGNKTAYTMTTVETATHHSYLYYYYNPGPDGQWFTSDDIKQTSYKVRNWNGIWDIGTFFFSAGNDNIPFTSDDKITAFSGPSYSNGVIDKFVYSTNPGNDNIYLTTDDPAKYYYPFTWNQDYSKLLRWHYSYIYYYYSYEYDTNNRPIKEIYYTGKGADNTWFTSDDVINSYKIIEYNNNNQSIRAIHYNAGPDGIWFNSDDTIIGYDENNILMMPIGVYSNNWTKISRANNDNSDSVIFYPTTAQGSPTSLNLKSSWSKISDKITFIQIMIPYPSTLNLWTPAIYVVNSDGSNPRQLTSNETANFNPTWLRNKEEIIFSRYYHNDTPPYLNIKDTSDDNWEIYLTNPNAQPGDEIKISHPVKNEVATSTISDGRILLYRDIENIEPDSGFYLLTIARDANGNATGNIGTYSSKITIDDPNNIANGTWIRWTVSPDDTKIAFEANFDGDYFDLDGTNVYYADFDVQNLCISNIKLIVKDQSSRCYSTAYPKWSKDGKSIIYNSNKTGKHQLYNYSLATGLTHKISPNGSIDYIYFSAENTPN